MGRIPCCEKDNVKKGQWTPEEDNKLSSYIAQHGTRNWRLIPKKAGLQRCGKSCRLRWTNYLRPDLKHGEFSEAEEQTIVKLHAVLGNRWSVIAAQLPGRTDNDVKNYWNTKLKKKLSGMGIDPVTHKPFSHLMAEIATALPPPHVANLAEAALGCFKDEMLHLLTKKRVEIVGGGLQPQQPAIQNPNANSSHDPSAGDRIRLGLPRAGEEQEFMVATDFLGNCGGYPPTEFGYGGVSGFVDDGEEWGSGTAGDGGGEEGGGNRVGEDPKVEKSGLFDPDCVLWDLPADDLLNPVV
ncbi:hypothetical protein MLD38_002199 [Melastoma candidum]|uniref:Uncharacterized protein n=1 Tax=Melastoma candidum TaxID=119954 RepID=A0ACB9SFS3_9MYRT|nr:hypothetical protein MLD38_002199 [Melastoma candidum]